MQFIGKYIGILRLLLEMSLILGLAYIGSQIVWKLTAPPQIEQVTDNARNTAYNERASDPASLQMDHSVLTRTNPFATQNLSDTVIEVASIEAPETSLNLSLKGIRASEDGQGVAFVLLPDNTEVRAEVGSEILNDVQVEYVFSDRITLRSRGKLETLYWRKTDGEQTGLVSVKAATDASNASLTRPSGPSAEQKSTEQKSATRVYSMDFETFFRTVDLSAVRENNRRSGYEVQPKSENFELSSTGFVAGDIIRQVNNRSVLEINSEDLEDILQSSPITTFEVERGAGSARVSLRIVGRR